MSRLSHLRQPAYSFRLVRKGHLQFCANGPFCCGVLAHDCFSQFFKSTDPLWVLIHTLSPSFLLTPLQALLGSTYISGCFYAAFPASYLSLYVSCPAPLPRQTYYCLYDCPAMNFIAMLYLRTTNLIDCILISVQMEHLSMEKRLVKYFHFFFSCLILFEFIVLYQFCKLIVIQSFRLLYGTSPRQCFLKLMIICSLDLNFSHGILLDKWYDTKKKINVLN